MTLAIDRYEYMNEDSINDELQCVICTRPYDSPVSLLCKHTFCLSCIDTWTKQNTSCPVCRKQYGAACIFIEVTDVTLCSQLDSLLVRCRRCGKDGIQRGKFQEHLKRCSRKRLALIARLFSNSFCSVGTRARAQPHRQSTTMRSTPVTARTDVARVQQPDTARLYRALLNRHSQVNSVQQLLQEPLVFQPQHRRERRETVARSQEFFQNFCTRLTPHWLLKAIFVIYMIIVIFRVLIMLVEGMTAALVRYWGIWVMVGIMGWWLQRRRGN